MAPRGARYADHLEGLVRLTCTKIGGGCALWSVGRLVVTCVVVNAIRRCGTLLLAREKQRSLLFVVDSPIV